MYKDTAGILNRFFSGQGESLAERTLCCGGGLVLAGQIQKPRVRPSWRQTERTKWEKGTVGREKLSTKW